MREESARRYVGYIGNNPKDLIAVLAEDGNFREQMHLLVEARKVLLRELSKIREFLELINKSLEGQGAEWRLDLNPAFELLGVHVGKTRKEKLRNDKPQTERLPQWRSENNPRVGAIMQSNIPLSARETQMVKLVTGCSDENLATTQVHWDAGKPLWDPKSADDHGFESNIWLQAVKNLGFERMSSISLSTDEKMTAAFALGINTREEQHRLLLACVLSYYNNHSPMEVLICGRSFGLEIPLSADFYMHVLPPAILGSLEALQKQAGHELPHHYLTAQYVQTLIDNS